MAYPPHVQAHLDQLRKTADDLLDAFITTHREVLANVGEDVALGSLFTSLLEDFGPEITANLAMVAIHRLAGEKNPS